MKQEQLEVGLFVWWERNESRGSSWSCPCVVTAVMREENRFQVRSLDDFQESGPLFIKRPPGTDPEALSEMRVCSSAEVRAYLDRKKRRLANAVDSARLALEAAEEAARNYAAQADAFMVSSS